MGSGAAGQRGGGAEEVSPVFQSTKGAPASPGIQVGEIGTLPRCPAAPPATWKVWMDEEPHPGWANMAIDQALLERADRAGESWLRLYSWSPPCLSFGRHEPSALRYDRNRIRESGVDTVRRPTGGRAVWHSHELTYAIAAPSGGFGSLAAAYLQIHQMLADALRGLGIPAYLARQAATPPLDSGACFSQPVGGEIMVGGRKIVGSAQLRQGGALLQHGSMLLQDNQYMVRELTLGSLGTCQRNPGVPQLAPAAEIARAITRTAAKRWPGSWETAIDEPAVVSEAASHYSHYRSEAWTWTR